VWGTVIGGRCISSPSVPIYLPTPPPWWTRPCQPLLPTTPKLCCPPSSTHLPLYAQIIFRRPALGHHVHRLRTLLAPSVTISENIIKELMPHHRMSQKKLLWITARRRRLHRAGGALFLWSLQTETSIHQMVENAYQGHAGVRLRLWCGLYWKRATIRAGCRLCWGWRVDCDGVYCTGSSAAAAVRGLIASAAGMLAGSLLTRQR